MLHIYIYYIILYYIILYYRKQFFYKKIWQRYWVVLNLKRILELHNNRKYMIWYNYQTIHSVNGKWTSAAARLYIPLMESSFCSYGILACSWQTFRFTPCWPVFWMIDIFNMLKIRLETVRVECIQHTYTVNCPWNQETIQSHYHPQHWLLLNICMPNRINCFGILTR